MEKNYWLGRWERHEIGWHQKETEEELVKFFSSIPPTRVLVPLCGKSLDMVWLASHGFTVIGAEVSALACDEFFAENKIPVSKAQSGDFVVYTAPNITIYNGDFFKLTTAQVKDLGAVYDRAALIALPHEVRKKYAAHMQALIKPSLSKDFRFLQLVLDRGPQDQDGPPFSVTPEEVTSLYSSAFKIRHLGSDDAGVSGPKGRSTTQHVFEFLA